MKRASSAGAAVGGLWLLAWLLAAGGCARSPAAKPQSGPPEVTVARPVVRSVVDFEDFPARLDAVASVDVRARVSGYLKEIGFKDGVEVPENTLLFVIDPRPYDAVLAQAKAKVEALNARLTQCNADLARAQKLLPTGAMTQEEYDAVVASRAEAAGSIAGAEAEVDRANLNVEFTRVTAPIAGRVSRTLITEGNLVTADTTLLTNLVSLDPIYAYFNVDERTVQSIREPRPAETDGPKRIQDIEVLLALAADAGFPHKGHLDFVDNRVDPSTGTIQIRAVFANPKTAQGTRALVPGYFARVRIQEDTPRQALTVPERALMTDQGQKYVLVVDDTNVVHRRPVKVGLLQDGQREIAEGLDADDRVIVEGLLRVRPGVTVKPHPAEPEAAPEAAGPAAPSKPDGGDATT